MDSGRRSITRQRLLKIHTWRGDRLLTQSDEVKSPAYTVVEFAKLYYCKSELHSGQCYGVILFGNHSVKVR
jgi:hypothetical protein